MTRSDHQPSLEPIVRPKRPREDMREVCNSTAAIVLATETSTSPIVVQFDELDKQPVTCEAQSNGAPLARPLQLFDGTTALEHALQAAIRAQVGMVYVLTVPQISQEVKRVSYAIKRRKDDPVVQVFEVEPDALLNRTREMGNVELFDIPFAILEIAHALAGDGFNRFESMLVMRADMVRITEDHLFELCEDFSRRKNAEVVASWIQWLRRPPYLISTGLLDRLVAEAQRAGEKGASEVPHIATVDHVFGEEKLAVNDAMPAGVDSFFESHPMMALQAVSLAEYSIEHPDEKLYSPNVSLSLIGPAAAKPLEDVERTMVDVAIAVRARSDYLDESELEELSWSDAFGKRNAADFPLLNDREHLGKLAYLDSAATSQRVDVALQAQRDFDEHENANVYRGGYPLSAQATFTFNDARKAVEDFIGAERRSVAFTANTTDALNLVALAWGEYHIEPDDLILTTIAEHHSAMLPFFMLAQRKGAQIEFVPYDSSGRIDQDVYMAALEKRPKLVTFAHIGNVFGIEAPVADMAYMAHEAGARVLLDAAQSFAHMPIDVSELGVDWLAFSGHKAYGPMGIGGLWISPQAFVEMDPLGGGGGVVSHVSTESYYLKQKSIQYEMGTPPVSQAVGLASAVGYLDSIGMHNVERHDATLTRYAVRGLEAIDEVTVVGDHSQLDGQHGLVSFTLRGVAPAQLAAFMGKLGVAIRSGGHCALPLHASLGRIGTGRLSVGVHTTQADIDAALVAIEMCRRSYEKK